MSLFRGDKQLKWPQAQGATVVRGTYRPGQATSVGTEVELNA